MTEVRTVTLGELTHDPAAIEGHEARLKNIDDLLASIPHEGQLQSLTVRPFAGEAPKKGKAFAWWVTAGNRRLAALRALRNIKGKVQGVVVTDDFPVHVVIKDQDAAGAYASSRAENLMRLPETPVEEFRAFEKMAKTMPAKEIAARFGITEKRVKQRLTLAALHPDVIDALDKNDISMEAAQAFTVQPDPEKQAAYLKKNASNSWALRPEAVKQAFTQKLVRGDSSVAKLIGKKAYVAAGGQVMGDVFDEKSSYWISPKIVDKLLAAHWEKQAAAWLEEGWLFVESAADFCRGDGTWVLYRDERRITPLPLPLPAELAAEIESVEAQKAALEAQHPSLADDFEAEEDDVPVPQKLALEHTMLERKLNELRRKVPREFTREQKALAGVVYTPDGSSEPRFGMLKKGAQVPPELGGYARDDDDGDEEDDTPSLLEPGREAVHILIDGMNAGLTTAVEANPLLALRLLLAALQSNDWNGPLDISRNYDLPGDDDDAPEQSFAAALEASDGKPIQALLVDLAPIVAAGLSLSPQAAKTGAAVLAAAKPSPRFDAPAYFAALSKPLLHEAWRDMRSPLDRDFKALADAPLADMAKRVEALAFDTKWLPPQLRTPAYDGPSFATKAAPADEPVEQMQAAE